MEKAGVRLSREKCEFRLSQLTYLGHQIDTTGIHPTSEKVQAIKEALVPQNIS